MKAGVTRRNIPGCVQDYDGARRNPRDERVHVHIESEECSPNGIWIRFNLREFAKIEKDYVAGSVNE